MKKLLLFAIVVSLAACGNPRSDGVSDDSTPDENSAVQPLDSVNRRVDVDTIYTEDGTQKPDSLRQ